MRKTIAMSLMGVLVLTLFLFNPPPVWAPVIEFILDKDNQPRALNPKYVILPGPALTPQLLAKYKTSGFAVFYEHTGIDGRSFRLNRDSAVKNLKKKSYPGFRKNWNDRISSISLAGCTTAILWGDSDYKGPAIILKNKEPITVSINKMPSGWNDRISSISVKKCTPCNSY